jgi:hypothetical protein
MRCYAVFVLTGHNRANVHSIRDFTKLRHCTNNDASCNAHSTIELCVKLPPLHPHLSYKEWLITHTSIPFRRCHSITVRTAVTDPEAAELRVSGR